ncbi:MAG: hypothetical protein PHH83_03605 [Patescibacteria group bacterium]|nr:hypothetical protein [Patescibacteria group bacterium]
MQEINNVQKNYKISALSYLWITCIIPLIFSKDEFVKFHAKQGLILSIIQIVSSFLIIIPVLGWIFKILIIFITFLAIKSALSGGKWKIPYIYELSQRINIK